MLKRILTVIMVVCLLPAMAHAWTLTTWVRSTGGALQIGSAAPSSSTVKKLTSFPTNDPVVVTVIPDPGYMVGSVNYNGTTLTNPTETAFIVNGPLSQTVYVWFVAEKFSITASVANNIGGTVAPVNLVNLTSGTVFATPQVFTFTPESASYGVTGITGIPAGAIQNPSVPVVGQPVTVTFPAGFTVTSNVVLVGTFAAQSPVAKAGNNQSAVVGKLVTLDGSGTLPGGSGVSSYSWTQDSGPAVTLQNATTAQASFTPAVTGSYRFTLTVMPGGSTASTTVEVFSDANNLVFTQCQGCHVAGGNPITIHAYTKWSGTKHELNTVVCTKCHIGADTGLHPGQFSQANSCNTLTCHGPGTPAINVTKPHPIVVGNNPCATCHDPHNLTVILTGPPHFNNITTGNYPASYATGNTTCANCHGANTAANLAIRKDWTASGHAKTDAPAWILDDYKTLDGCVRCHTTTGFIAYSTAQVTKAWGVSTDKTKEVLRCTGCHSNVETGATRTNVTLNNPYPDEPSFTNNNVSTSNLCINCHSGANNGQSIQVKVGSANFANLPYIASHGMSAAGSLQSKSAFHFPGRAYPDYTENSHRKVGMNDSNTTGTQGPCVACHMSSPSKHTFASTSSANGAIVKIKTNVCTNCHSTSLPAAALDAKRVEFNSALDVLRAALQAKGFTYSSVAPYFSNTNWGTGQAGANVMGAAYNYRLFLLESSVYTHNPAYARQLVVDSIDAAYNNGTLTGDITSALTALVGSGSITQAQADSLNAYKNSNSCNSCHGAPPATPSHGLATLANCTNCHIYTGPAADTHNNGIVNFQATMACGSCHLTAATTPQLATGTHSQHFAVLQSTDPLIVCTKCHTYNGDTVTPHNNGTLDLSAGCSTALCHGSITPPVWGTYSNNNSCTKCHGTGAATVDASNRYVVAPSDATAADTGKVSANAKTGAHQTHIRLLNGLSPVGTADSRCQNCHGTLPVDPLHSNGSSTPAFQGLATKDGAMSASFTGTSCSNTYCHNPAGAGGTLNSSNTGVGITPSWTNSGYIADGTLKTLNNCNQCHKVPGEAGFTSTMNHGTVTIADDCAGCHSHNGDIIGVAGKQHIDGILSGNGTCDACHGYPPMSQTQFDARVPGMYPNAKVEDYLGGGGHHDTHLPTTVTAANGFTPCLPCHPSGSHMQGGSVVTKANINVFEAADLNFRFDETRAKRYEVATQSCSNVSCHFQPTVSW